MERSVAAGEALVLQFGTGESAEIALHGIEVGVWMRLDRNRGLAMRDNLPKNKSRVKKGNYEHDNAEALGHVTNVDTKNASGVPSATQIS